MTEKTVKCKGPILLTQCFFFRVTSLNQYNKTLTNCRTITRSKKGNRHVIFSALNFTQSKFVGCERRGSKISVERMSRAR